MHALQELSLCQPALAIAQRPGAPSRPLRGKGGRRAPAPLLAPRACVASCPAWSAPPICRAAFALPTPPKSRLTACECVCVCSLCVCLCHGALETRPGSLISLTPRPATHRNPSRVRAIGPCLAWPWGECIPVASEELRFGVSRRSAQGSAVPLPCAAGCHPHLGSKGCGGEGGIGVRFSCLADRNAASQRSRPRLWAGLPKLGGLGRIDERRCRPRRGAKRARRGRGPLRAGLLSHAAGNVVLGPGHT